MVLAPGWRSSSFLAGPVLQLARIYVQRHRHAFACEQVDAVESCRSPYRELDFVWNLAGCARYTCDTSSESTVPLFLMWTRISRPPSKVYTTCGFLYSKVV
jgi:hypothetical protein